MRLGELADRLGARVLGDADLDVQRVRAVDEARAGDLAFVDTARDRRAARETLASAVLVSEEFAAEHAHELPCTTVAVPSIGRALALAVELLHPPRPAMAGIHSSAVVDPRARIGPGVAVGPLAVVGDAVLGAGSSVGALALVSDDVEIGEGTTVGPGAIIMAGTRVGAHVLIGPGAVLGDEGFVYAPIDEGSVTTVPVRHVAGLVVGDEAAIGANACVDRGALRDTRVGARARLDNLVQVGHDVVVGDDAVLVAQVGIGGDSRIGAGAVLAGQAGVGDHKVVGARARVGGQAGVTRDVPERAAVSGTPAMPHGRWLRSMARFKTLDALEERVRQLEARLAAHERPEAVTHPDAAARRAPTRRGEP